MKLRPYDLDSLTRAVCAHMVARGSAVVVVDEGVIETPDGCVFIVNQEAVENNSPPNVLADLFAEWIKSRDGAGARVH